MTGTYHPKILLLDDDPFILKLVTHQLNILGHHAVWPASNGQQALSIVDGGKDVTGLIFLDLNMPEMDGIEFVHHLVDRNYSGSLVLMSGEDGRMLHATKTLIEAHNINLLGTLHKPMTLADLRSVLDAWKPLIKLSTTVYKQPYTAERVNEAIEKGELVNYYQPQVDLTTGQIIGFETLVRWLHPEDGLIPPDQFIPTAESAGHVQFLTRWVISEALAQAQRWHDDGYDWHVSVNVSMYDLVSLSFINYIVEQTSKANLTPSNVMIEVTESRLMRDQRVTLEILTRLRMKRFKLSIDDFGTGHSSLTQLRDIPFDELKIDKSFVHGADKDETLSAIFAASVDMARTLGMDVVAEGIEDRRDWNYVRQSGCKVAQGYFIGKPMLARDIPNWIDEWKNRLLHDDLSLNPNINTIKVKQAHFQK